MAEQKVDGADQSAQGAANGIKHTVGPHGKGPDRPVNGAGVQRQDGRELKEPVQGTAALGGIRSQPGAQGLRLFRGEPLVNQLRMRLRQQPPGGILVV